MDAARRVCFGVPSVFSFGSPACVACADTAACREASRAELVHLKDFAIARHALIEHERHAGVPVGEGTARGGREGAARPKVRAARRKHRCLPMTEVQRAIISSMPIRVGDYLIKLFKRGHDAEIRLALREGKPPLEGVAGYRSLKVALMHLKGGFDRRTLRTCFMEELGWSYTSAWNEVSVMWSTLPALGVAIERGGRLIVAPSVVTNN